MTGSQAGVKVEHGAHPETSSIVFMYGHILYVHCECYDGQSGIKGNVSQDFSSQYKFFQKNLFYLYNRIRRCATPCGKSCFFLQARPDLRHGWNMPWQELFYR
jgi:hypothetical protein